MSLCYQEITSTLPFIVLNRLLSSKKETRQETKCA